MKANRLFVQMIITSLVALIPVLAAQEGAIGQTGAGENPSTAKEKIKAKAKLKKDAANQKAFQRVIIDLDVNQDQVIQRSEVPEQARKEFDDLLEIMDQNKDKALSRDELQATGARIQRILGQGKVAGKTIVENGFGPRERLKRMDKNRDGLISRDEWLGMPPVFDRLDRDGDGSLSASEQEAAISVMEKFMEKAKSKQPAPKKKAVL